MTNYTNEQKDKITQVIAGLNNGLGIDKDLQIKMENLDREFTYHQFYFPGCDLRLRIEGIGEDNEHVKYIKDTSVSFDPRYIEDYINSANSGGFHRYLIYFNPFSNDWEPISFDQITSYLQKYYRNGKINPNYESDSSVNELLKSIFASLIYFDKLNCYKSEISLYQDPYSANSIDVESFDKFIDNKGVKTSNYLMKKLPSKIGRNYIDFQKKDTGYMAPKSLAFNISQDMIDLINKYELEYKEYKDKLWSLLEGLDSLQLCVNRNNSIIQANGEAEVSITQMNNCVQNIQNINAKLNEEKTTGNKEQKNISETPNNSIVYLNEKLKSAEKIVEERNKQMKIMIIVLIIIIVLFIGITILYLVKIIRSKRNRSNISIKN